MTSTGQGTEYDPFDAEGNHDWLADCYEDYAPGLAEHLAELDGLEREFQTYYCRPRPLPSWEHRATETPSHVTDVVLDPHSDAQPSEEQDQWLHFDEELALFGNRPESAFFVQDSTGVQRTHGAFAL